MNPLHLLLSSLILYTHNTKILHWDVKGIDFDPTHEKLDEYYELLSGLVDEVAELGMQLDVRPVGLLEAMNILEGDTTYHFTILSGSQDFDSRTAYQTIDRMFTTLLELYDVVCKTDIPGDVVNKLQEHMYTIRKQLQYKNKQRLK